MKYLILGGTGTLGRALTAELLKHGDTKSIVCFSRDELKQKETEAFFKSKKLSFRIGDIRDSGAVGCAMTGVDAVFHVSALKHVDTIEANPEESVKTNVLGTMNVANAAISLGVPQVVFSSTDKAVAPVNVYGMCKGISERILLGHNKTQTRTKFSVYRWGNVAGSRGAAPHYFAKTLQEEKRAYVTDAEMTRFWIRIEDAVKFMITTYQESDGIMVPPMKSSKVTDMVEAIARLKGVSEYETKIVGLRPGEKIHESILPDLHSSDGPFYTVPELMELVGPSL